MENNPGKASWQEITKTLPDSIVEAGSNREAKTWEGIHRYYFIMLTLVEVRRLDDKERNQSEGCCNSQYQGSELGYFMK